MTAELQILVTPPGSNPVEVSRWQAYNINLGVRVPAASFSLTIPANAENRNLLKPGYKIEIKSYDAIQLTGIIDERSDATRGDSTDMMVAGRCVMGLLLDTVVPHNMLSIANLTLAQVAEKAVAAFPNYFTGITTNLAASRYIMAGGSGGSAGLTRTQSPVETPINQKALDAALAAGNLGLALQLALPRQKTAEFVKLASGNSAGKVGTNSPYFAGVGGEQFIKHRVKLGTTWYALLSDLAKQIGAHIFSAADGHLAIVRPCYTTDPSAYGQGIVLNWDAVNRRAAGGNVLGVDCTTSIVGRCSEYIVAGMGKDGKCNTYSSGGEAVALVSGGKWKLAPVSAATKGYGSIMDPGPAFWSWDSTYTIPTQRLVKTGYIETKTTNSQRLTRLIRRKMIENALSAYQLNYQVQGHHSPAGILYTPDTCINVLDQRNKISGIYYINSVKRTSDMKDGRRTTLKLWPINLWLTDNDESTVSWEAFYQAIAPLVTW